MRKLNTESTNQKLAIRNNQKSDYRKSDIKKLKIAESRKQKFASFLSLLLLYFNSLLWRSLFG